MTKLNAMRPTCVYVAFGGRRTYFWTHFLKKNYNHCFLVVGFGFWWTIIDPVLAFTDIFSLQSTDIKKVFAEKGYTLVKAKIDYDYKKVLHLRPLTCVESVKRFLGITNPWIFTPYQLYKYIKKEEE